MKLQKGNKLQWDGTPRGRNCNNFFRQLSLRKRKDPGKNPYRPSGECKAKAKSLPDGRRREARSGNHGRDPDGNAHENCGRLVWDASGSPETDKLIAASVQ
jgi:hypothetical protein